MSEARPAPITVQQHLERVLSAVEPMAAFDLPLMEAHDTAVAADVSATAPLPGFDNSAMDGYAVVHADVVDARDERPIHLPVVGEIGAGQAQILAMSPGTAVKIMTGAPIPRGCDAVVPYEWTDRGVAQVQIAAAPSMGQHIRRAGEDVGEGDLLVSEGTVLGPRHLGLLAAAGLASVPARPRPRVVVMSTGSELREPGQALGHDSINDANSYLLAAAARAAGCIAYRVGVVPDEPGKFIEALTDQLVRADVVVTSGGISQGDYDVVKEALADLGTMWFGEVAMQPGKPQGFGTVGEDDTLLFTLPGNPVSAYVSFQAFVVPALRKLRGREPYERPMTHARLTQALKSMPGRQQFVRASCQDAVVSPVGGHGSHLIGDLAESNALIVVPSETTAMAAGEQVEVLLLDQVD